MFPWFIHLVPLQRRSSFFADRKKRGSHKGSNHEQVTRRNPSSYKRKDAYPNDMEINRRSSLALMKSPQGKVTASLEASYRHLPETPSHLSLQKVRGDMDRLIRHGEKQRLKNTPMRLVSQREK